MISRQNLPRTSQLFPAKNTVRDKIVELLILFRCEDPRATSDLTVLSRMKAIVFYTEKKKKKSRKSIVRKQYSCQSCMALLVVWMFLLLFLDCIFELTVPHSAILDLSFDSLGKPAEHKSANKNES